MLLRFVIYTDQPISVILIGAQKGRFCAREWNFLQLVRRKGDSAHGRGGEGSGGEQGPGICRTSCATSLGLREKSNSGRAGTALFAVLRAGPYESELSTALCAERKNAALACSVRIALHCAEREGFEPPEPFSSTVFKTAVIDHSTTSPFPKRDCKYRYFIYFLKKFFDGTGIACKCPPKAWQDGC